MFQGCFKDVSRMFHMRFKCASRMHLACFTGIGRKFKAFVKDHSRVLLGHFGFTSWVFNGDLRVFQGFKKFLLHARYIRDLS